MNFHVVRLSTPLHWQGREYIIDGCGMRDGESYAVISPDEPEVVEEIKRRVRADSGLKVYLGPGYTCFIEDSQSR